MRTSSQRIAAISALIGLDETLFTRTGIYRTLVWATTLVDVEGAYSRTRGCGPCGWCSWIQVRSWARGIDRATA